MKIILLLLLIGCGQYHSDDKESKYKCYGPNEEACVELDADVYCGVLV